MWVRNRSRLVRHVTCHVPFCYRTDKGAKKYQVSRRINPHVSFSIRVRYRSCFTCYIFESLWCNILCLCWRCNALCLQFIKEIGTMIGPFLGHSINEPINCFVFHFWLVIVVLNGRRQFLRRTHFRNGHLTTGSPEESTLSLSWTSQARLTSKDVNAALIFHVCSTLWNVFGTCFTSDHRPLGSLEWPDSFGWCNKMNIRISF